MTVPLVFGLAGQGGAIAFLISTISVLLVALNVNQFARISASPGSLYTYITDHMHPRWGVLAGWALLIAYVGTAAAVSAGVTNYANVILRDRFGVQAFPLLLTALVMVLACYLAYRDVQISARLMLWLEAGIGGPDFRHRDRHYRQARMAPRHGATHVARRHSGKASPGPGARDLQLGGI